ncbi:two-component regulator propeller domain-containing protein [Spirosoma sp. KNUC1025]|uniref:ligand-binding sensor domain-containing protein n=1 Tax=Spirosoma sp. KNUC1025 TaxID=2894082 RepID=UPI001E297AC6|nr:sensor histidine kinase [Spirosoma sp. KNUC1025]UFH57538.1 histidine kinase [Spirosoma sp. KNUC1025]
MARKINIVGWMRALLLTWLVGWTGVLNGQDGPAQFEFRHIQEKDGLSFNTVSCFLQDRDGFLWIGTFDGLNRYDGTNFIYFKNRRSDANSLPHNTVWALCEDLDGNIWVTTETGVSRYEKSTGRFRSWQNVQGRALGVCSNILCDNKGDIWFTSTRAGLFCYRPKSECMSWFSFNPKDDLQTVSTQIWWQSLLDDPLSDGLWVADKKEGLRYFDKNRKQFYEYVDAPALNRYKGHTITALTRDGDQLIFSDETEKHIVIFDLRRGRVVKTLVTPREPDSDPPEINHIYVDRQHNLWVCTWGNTLFFVEGGTYRVRPLLHQDTNPLSIAGTFFSAGWQHPDGSIWLGTVNGISITNPKQTFYAVHNINALFPTVSDEQGIIAFHEEEDGSWWLGTAKRGLLHYHPQTNRLSIHKLPNATAANRYGSTVVSIMAYGNDLILGGNNALFRFNKRTGQFTTLPTPPFVTADKRLMHAFLLQGDELWIWGQSRQIYCQNLRTGQWRNYPVASAIDNRKLKFGAIQLDRRGGLWLHTNTDGFVRFSQQRGQFIPADAPPDDNYNQAINNTIASCEQDSTGLFWLASGGYGLLQYDPKRRSYKRLTESEGLVYDHCGAALPDRYGHVWVGAYNRFSVYTPQTRQFTNFTLPFNESSTNYDNRLFSLRNGHIVGALRGYLVEFFPEKLANRSAGFPNKVLVSYVSIGDTTWLNHSGLSGVNLKAEETGFAVHFAALTSASQTPFRYKYRLEGYDDWKQADDAAYAVYTRIPGGNYTFSVKGVAADGRETPVSSLAIHIDTLFYRTVWFWACVGFILLGLVVGFLWYRSEQVAQVHDLQVQATRLARDKSEIQYQNLINHLNPHFLFNSLTSLNSLININPREASTFLRKLSLIYRYILQNKDKELVTLDDELTFVQHYIDLQKSRFDDALQIRMDVPADYRTRLIVPVTIQNLLENAIKHNTIDEDSPLVIQIYPERDCLCIVNNLQTKSFVETSNKQGLASLKSMYHYLSHREIDVSETDTHFTVKVPLL